MSVGIRPGTDYQRIALSGDSPTYMDARGFNTFLPKPVDSRPALCCNPLSEPDAPLWIGASNGHEPEDL